MKLTKKTEKVSNGQTKGIANKWKSKAINRRKDNEGLRKRLKEVQKSRDNWKLKYKTLKSSGVKSRIDEGTKAKKHQYSLALVVLIIEMYKYGGMSLRGCRHSIYCLFLCCGLTSRIPSHTSIRNWLCKCGIYRVQEYQESRGDYIIYIDESMSLGNEKILLILGILGEDIRFDKSIDLSISHEDVKVLYVGVRKEWKSEFIAKILNRINKNKSVLYAVSDEGSNLKSTYKLLNYNHVRDCTHKLTNYIKHLFKKDKLFDGFRRLIGQLRQIWSSSKVKHVYMPPNMRTKLRFANIFPCVNWAEKMLNKWDRLNKEIQDALMFLKTNEAFIKSLVQVGQIFKIVCSILKNKGFGIIQKQEILAKLESFELSEKAIIFMNKCKEYLEDLTKQMNEIGCQNLICTSDIIESYFGKFKTKINANSQNELTEFIFTMATYGQSFSTLKAKKALETIQCKDLKLTINKIRNNLE